MQPSRDEAGHGRRRRRRRRRARRRPVDDEHRHRATPTPRSRRSRASPTRAARSCASPSRTPTRSTGFAAICAGSPLPVVADIHFDHRLAIEAARLGAAKLRINPGNIGATERVDAVIDAAGEAGIPIRIGVNAGSLAEEYAERDWPLADKLVASAVAFCEHFAARGFDGHRRVARRRRPSRRPSTRTARSRASCPYPLHLGVTEAGTLARGHGEVRRSASASCSPRASATRCASRSPPTRSRRSRVAWDILAALDIRRRGPELVSCPTCGRCEVDLIPIAEEVERRLRAVRTPLKVAVMGCVVNGPGEARDADIGVAAGKGVGLVFAKGEPVRKVPEAEIVDALMERDRVAGRRQTERCACPPPLRATWR